MSPPIAPGLYQLLIGLLVVATVSELLPVIAWAPRWAGLSRGLRFAAAATAVSVIADIVEITLARRHTNNLWVMHVDTPFYAALSFLAIAEWQRTVREQRAVRLLAAVFVVYWIVATWRLEDMHRFSNYTRPVFEALVCVLTGYTLLRRAPATHRPLTEESWFWISAGWLLVSASSVMLGPVANVLLDAKSALLYALPATRAAFTVVSNILLTIGFLRARSGSAPEVLVLT